MDAKYSDVKITPQMIEAAERVIADRFDLELGGYRAHSVAEEVIRAALVVAQDATARSR